MNFNNKNIDAKVTFNLPKNVSSKKSNNYLIALKIVLLVVGTIALMTITSPKKVKPAKEDFKPLAQTCPESDKKVFTFGNELKITSEPGLKVSENLQESILNMIDLYECHPSKSNFDIYHPNAEFEDPICYAKGIKEIKTQFYGMPKVFTQAKIVKCNVLSIEDSSYPYPANHMTSFNSTTNKFELFNSKSESSVSKVIMELWQLYSVGSTEIPMKSLVTLDFDLKTNLVIRHQDFWDYEDSWNLQLGPLGWIWNGLRRANGKYLPSLVPIPE